MSEHEYHSPTSNTIRPTSSLMTSWTDSSYYHVSADKYEYSACTILSCLRGWIWNTAHALIVSVFLLQSFLVWNFRFRMYDHIFLFCLVVNISSDEGVGITPPPPCTAPLRTRTGCSSLPLTQDPRCNLFFFFNHYAKKSPKLNKEMKVSSLFIRIVRTIKSHQFYIEVLFTVMSVRSLFCPSTRRH